MAQKNLLIYSTIASQYFAKLIVKDLGIEIGAIDRRTFDDGELYHRLVIESAHDIIGKTAIFVASTHTDQDFNELEKIGYTLSDLGARRIIFVIPYFGYSTMERAVLPGEAVAAKINAQRLSRIPNTGQSNIFLMLDLHASVILHYFEGDCLRFELSANDLLVSAISRLKLKNFVFGTADLGKAKQIELFANKFKTKIVFIRKSRHFGQTKAEEIIGMVRGKNVIIYDDMVRSGNTLIDAARFYLKAGAVKIYAVLSHFAINNKEVISKLEKSPIEKIIATNSHPMSQNKSVQQSKKIIIEDVSPVFIEMIKKITI